MLRKLQITGNTRLNNLDLREPYQELLKPFVVLIGQQVSFQQLNDAAATAQAAIRNRGYITSLVLIPEQSFANGVLRVQVVESFVERLSLQGGGNALQAYARKMLQPVVGEPGEQRLFNMHNLERQLLLIRAFGAVDVKATLYRGKQFGGSELVAVIQPTRPSASLLSDNNLPLQLGSWRLGALLQGYVASSQPIKIVAIGNNAFSVPGGFADGFVQAQSPLGNQGWLSDVLWGTTSTNSKDLLNGPNSLQTGGLSNYWSAGISYPLVVRRNAMLTLGLKGTLQNSSNDLFINGEHILDLGTDRIRAVRLTLDGYAVSRKAINQLGFVLSQGFSGLGSNLAANEQLSNLNGAPNFTTARLNLSRQQQIASIGQSVTLATLKGSAQASRTALPVPEQFTYGGPVLGRAFNSAYLLGDQGWAGSFELGQRFVLSSGLRGTSLMPFAWYDYGFTNGLESDLPNQAAATYGIGARGGLLGGDTNIEVGWGMPSTNTLQPRRTGVGNSIVYFKLGMKF
jgi:hemolysin activation/secretion protein